MAQTKGETVLGCVSLIGQVFIVLPLWYHLLYQILVKVEASTSMWTAYWIYMPCGFLVAIVASVAKAVVDQN